MRRGEDTTSVYLRMPTGDLGRLTVHAVPDPAGTRVHLVRVRRLLAVSVRLRAGEVSCSFLATTPTGPVHKPISLAVALALAESGVHTVIGPLAWKKDPAAD